MGKVAAKYSIGNSSQSARLRLLMFIRRFIGLWAIFVQVPKSLIFQVKSFLGNFYGHLANFSLVTLVSMLTVYFINPILLSLHVVGVEMLFEKNENKQKEAGVGSF